MNLIDEINQVFPTVLGWAIDIIEFLQWVSELFYVNVYVVILHAIGIPVEIANAIVTIATGAVALYTIIKFYCTYIDPL